jgi:hypothetical protein
MNSPQVPIGSQIAADLPPTSPFNSASIQFQPPATLDDLLRVWEQEPPRELPVLKTTCSLLSEYLEASIEEIRLDWLSEMRGGFRAFLLGRRYRENSVRTYVNHVQILLRSAGQYGWRPDEYLPESWRQTPAGRSGAEM